ncbi:hypothetical protein DV738_g2669, partial [Chaetothyriales sp. CBS 135597]
MLGGILFAIWRFNEIVTLVPIVGMLGWFVNGFNSNNQLTPSFILVLFIVSTLACAWALVTLLRLGSTRRSALFVAFVDLCFVGAFIAADYYLRGIGDANCSHFTSGTIFVNLGPFGYYGAVGGSRWAVNLNKNCAMLKASWVFGIMNTIMFFFTFVLALFLHRHHQEKTVVREAVYDPQTGYITNIESIRSDEYPSLSGTVYLDHAGTTLYPKSLIEEFSKELTGNVFGNPHSASAASQLSTRKVEDVRLAALRFFNASPDEYDLVFTANATAAIKLVADLFRDPECGFEYAYHEESHTSLVGVRELAGGGSICFSTPEDLSQLLDLPARTGNQDGRPPLVLAFPGQSNMTGRKFLQGHVAVPVNKLRRRQDRPIYTLCDAAALAATSPLDFAHTDSCADFTAISFYKIFGFPDLGGLILRKSCADLVRRRKYFGGGTVDSVVACGDAWHAKRDASLHAQLEDGTLPFHNIIALGLAFDVHRRTFGTMSLLSSHVRYLSESCLCRLKSLRHSNGQAVCIIYGKDRGGRDENSGPVISFNVLDSAQQYVSCVEFEKICIVRNIQIRTGGLCNPGGTAGYLGLTPVDIQHHHASGYRCGGAHDLINGRPTGTIRVSFGAASSLRDVDTFVAFMEEFFVDKTNELVPPSITPSITGPCFEVESLSVYPIKSCAAFNIRPGLAWEVRPQDGGERKRLTVSLSSMAGTSKTIIACEATTGRRSSVCGESLQIEHYTSPDVSGFFTEALGIPCTLAKLPHNLERRATIRQPEVNRHPGQEVSSRLISLSNESPILLICRSSVNKLNEDIKTRGGPGKAVSADAFRANIVISEVLEGGQLESPFAEDNWTTLCVQGDHNRHSTRFEVLGPCQRCQVVCVDQKSARRNGEPFSTLSKTRRRNGKVWFGMHICLVPPDRGRVFIKVGDKVAAS